MKTRIANVRRRKNNSKKLREQKKERFERAAHLGRSHLIEAIASLVQGDPDVALSIIDDNAYPVAALLAKELTELSGQYVPVVPRDDRPTVAGMHLVNLVQQLWAEILRQADEVEELSVIGPDDVDDNDNLITLLEPCGDNPDYVGDELQLVTS